MGAGSSGRTVAGGGAGEAAGSGGRGLGLAALPLSDGEMPAGGVKCPAP